MKRKAILIALFCALCARAAAQQRPELSGYISAMPSLVVMQPADHAWWQTLLHNRINFGWQLHEHWHVHAGMRNRLIAGSAEMMDPAGADADNGLVDLSWNWTHNTHTLGNTAFDRLHLTFENGRWKMQLGRQRINWGQTFVWNPNDIFNTHSFFDFDYPERAGCDALRTTYYHSPTAYSELAASVNHRQKISAALLHHWNYRDVDYQLIAGQQAETDLVIGGAWTGDFKGLNFRGEWTYFHPISSLADTTGTIALAAGLDYMCSNSLMIQAEVLYNNAPSGGASGGGLMDLYSAPLSAKRLSICTWNVFAQVSYPVTPRLNGALSGMYFVDAQSCYGGLSLDYSVLQNLDFSLIAQYFSTLGASDLGDMRFILGFARIKYSF